MARIGDKRGAYRVLMRRPKRNSPPGRQGVDGKIILKWNFKNWDGEAWPGLSGSDRDRWRVLVNAKTNLRVRDLRLPMRSC
jgi:hypothetical protein